VQITPTLAAGLALVAATVCAAQAHADKSAFNSKIGIHLIGDYTEGAKKIIASECPVIKVLDTHRSMMEAVRDYKTRHPDGIVVLRTYTPIQHSVTDSPAVRAQLFWDQVLWPQLSRLSDQQKRWIDYVEGPNECETPCWRNLEDAKWNRDFYLTLIPIMVENGFKPCIANIPVGNPPGPPEDVAAKIRAFLPALRLANKVGGCWSYHSYTLKYTKDPAVELHYSLRYRRFYQVFAKYDPRLLDMPLILTEGGVDSDGSHPERPGWKRETAEKYQDWLKWFDSQMKKDPYVKGITLFEIGDPRGWDSFDLEPIADWLAGYLRSGR
jgi:hypothetical protein